MIVVRVKVLGVMRAARWRNIEGRSEKARAHFAPRPPPLLSLHMMSQKARNAVIRAKRRKYIERRSLFDLVKISAIFSKREEEGSNHLRVRCSSTRRLSSGDMSTRQLWEAGATCSFKKTEWKYRGYR